MDQPGNHILLRGNQPAPPTACASCSRGPCRTMSRTSVERWRAGGHPPADGGARVAGQGGPRAGDPGPGRPARRAGRPPRQAAVRSRRAGPSRWPSTSSCSAPRWRRVAELHALWPEMGTAVWWRRTWSRPCPGCRRCATPSARPWTPCGPRTSGWTGCSRAWASCSRAWRRRRAGSAAWTRPWPSSCSAPANSTRRCRRSRAGGGGLQALAAKVERRPARRWPRPPAAWPRTWRASAGRSTCSAARSRWYTGGSSGWTSGWREHRRQARLA